MDEAYQACLAEIEDVLDAVLPKVPGGAWPDCAAPDLDLPPEAAWSLAEPGRDLLSRGGKRWRPLLQVLVCQALGGGKAALPLTPLVELCHNASLIHDDIEDGSGTRRGRPAAHILYGQDRAINTGSFLYFLPLACIDGWYAPEERKLAAYRLQGEHLRRLHLGQAMDIAWHRDFSARPPVADYEKMCRLKTGSLARLAALLGALAAGALDGRDPARPGPGPWDAAEMLGLAFQILDDVKNLTTGNPGKKRGDDVVEGKKSLPVLLFLERRPEKAPFVERCFAAARTGGPEAPEVEALIGECAAAGVIGEAARKGEAILGQAREILAATGEGEGRRLLAGFADLLL